MIRHQEAIHEIFNARFLDAEQVGSSFVLSPFLDDLIPPHHSAILGPRGSGKTTLLKMLTLPALYRWSDPQKSVIAKSLEYLSIYVPANLTWSAEYRTFSLPGLEPDIESLLSTALFRHGVLAAMLSSWRQAANPILESDTDLNSFYLSIDAEKEVELARSIAAGWGLDLEISSMSGVRNAISKAVRLLQKITVTSTINRSTAAELVGRHPFIASNFLDDVSFFVDFLEDTYKFRKKIALCFDELEIATDAVADVILRAPRSIDSRVIIKFSAAPYVGVASSSRDASVPTDKNDFDLVFLSSFSSRDTRDFSEKLFASMCLKQKVAASPEQILGRSFLEVERRTNDADSPIGSADYASRYAVSGSTQRKFAALYEIDADFRRYMHEKSLDVSDLSTGTEKRRAADIRKILWPVLVREEFLFDQERPTGATGRRRRLRSKSSVSDIYTGAGSLFALCEGNPRWMLGLLEPMIAAYANENNFAVGSGTVRRSLQKKRVEDMVAAYFALLSTIPSASSLTGIDSLVNLVDQIGFFFRRSVLGTKFNPDPVLAFIVDDKVPPVVRELIGKGINIGAFVTTNKSRNTRGYRVGDIEGLKVRLSNIFAPHYKLPLAAGRTINLSTILFKVEPSNRSTMIDLFGDRL